VKGAIDVTAHSGDIALWLSVAVNCSPGPGARQASHVHAHTGRFADHRGTYYDRNWQKLNVLGIVDGVRPISISAGCGTR
jgi:hypothetical protein